MFCLVTCMVFYFISMQDVCPRRMASFIPNRSLDIGEIARLCHAACFWPSRRRSGLPRNRMRTEAGKMPESLISPIRNGHGVSNDRFGFIGKYWQDSAARRSSSLQKYIRNAEPAYLFYRKIYTNYSLVSRWSMRYSLSPRCTSRRVLMEQKVPWTVSCTGRSSILISFTLSS